MSKTTQPETIAHSTYLISIPRGFILQIVFAMIALLSMAGCQKGTSTSSTDETKPSTPPPERIISFVPSLTEIAFDLGLGPKMVGVGDFASYPPAVNSLPRVGGLINPNLEQTLALRPDLLLVSPAQTSVIALARAKSIPTLVQPTDSLDDVFTSIIRLGEAAQIDDVAKARVKSLKQEIEALESSRDTPRPTVLLVIGRDPGSLKGLMAAGEGSFLDALLRVAGGRNALTAELGLWPSVSKEYLLSKPPDIIIEFSTKGEDAIKETALARKVWSALPQLSAVKQGKVFKLVGDHLLLPGPRAVKTIADLREALTTSHRAPSP